MQARHPRFAPHRNTRCRMRDFTWRGRRCITLENELMRVLVSADKGSDILELLHKPSDTEMLCQAPAGPATPHDEVSSPLAQGHFRDRFPGGWYVMLPNGPVPCAHRGAAFGQHGEATFLSWDAYPEEDTPERIAITFRTRLRRLPLFVERRFALTSGAATLTLDESVTSEAGHVVELLWGHHPTFGAPLIEEGSVIDLPACTAATDTAVPDGSVAVADARAPWPLFPAPEGGQVDLSRVPGDDTNAHDFIRLEGLASGWFSISNARRGAGVALRWDETRFPVLGLWRMLGGEGDYPWYQARRMIALEPACDLPSLAAAAARGTAVVLAPGETVTTRLEATLFTPQGRVGKVDWGGVLEFAEERP